jgi:hypothetical protein
MKIIYTNNEGGVSVVHPTGEVPIEELPTRLGLVDYEIVEDSVILSDRTFRNAWVKSDATVVEDLAKSKEIAHDRRRVAREAEFAPHDEVIARQIPGEDATAAEAARAAIRTKYETMQTDIDAATDTATLKTILQEAGA